MTLPSTITISSVLVTTALAFAAIPAHAIAETESPPQSIEVEVEHDGPLIQGDFKTVELSITAPESSETAGRPLRGSVNVGSISEITRVSGSKYHAVYTAPTPSHPQVVLLAIWRETGPNAAVRFVRIPLFGRTTVPVRTTAGAEVKIIVGDVSFGPITASKSGRADVPIVVPPGLESVTAISTDQKGESQVSVQTGVPPYNRLTLALTPYLVPADGQSMATVLAYYDKEPSPDISRVLIRAPRGRISPLGREGPLYRFSFVPDRDRSAHDVTLSASIKGDKTAKATALLTLGTPVPQQILTYVGNTRLVTGRNETSRIGVFVVDRLGLGIADATVTATSAVARIVRIEKGTQGETEVVVEDPVTYPPNGLTVLEFSVDNGPSIHLRHTVSLPTDPPPWPSRATIAFEKQDFVLGRDMPVPIRITVFDARGEPFASKDLELEAEGAMVTPLKASAPGSYETTATLLPSADRVIFVLKDKSGHFEERKEVPILGRTAFTVGPRVGLVLNGGLSFEVGAEVELKRAVGALELGVFGRVAYRRRSLNLPETTVLGQAVQASSTLDLLPLTLGLRGTVPLDDAGNFAAYIGAGFSLGFSSHRTQQKLPNLPEVSFEEERRSTWVPGFDSVLGMSAYGVFVELNASYLKLNAPELQLPRWAGIVAAGVRFDLLGSR